MRLLIIDRADSWHVNDLKRAAGCDWQIETATYDQLAVRFSDSGESEFFAGPYAVKEFDAIFTRAMPAASLEQIVFRMDWLLQVEQQLRKVIVNPARTIELAVDKYLSLEQLRSHDIPVPASNVTQTTEKAIEFFEQNGCDSVVKPIFGSRGRNIVRINLLGDALQYFDQLESLGAVIYQQQFVDHGDVDFRLLVVGDRVFGMRRQRQGHWIVNASLGATCDFHEVSEFERDLAIRAAHSQNSMIAGVDVVYRERDRQPFVVEVNACPSWQNLSLTTTADISKNAISLIEDLCGLRPIERP